jgi:hypothetical protein
VHRFIFQYQVYNGHDKSHCKTLTDELVPGRLSLFSVGSGYPQPKHAEIAGILKIIGRHRRLIRHRFSGRPNFRYIRKMSQLDGLSSQHWINNRPSKSTSNSDRAWYALFYFPERWNSWRHLIWRIQTLINFSYCSAVAVLHGCDFHLYRVPWRRSGFTCWPCFCRFRLNFLSPMASIPGIPFNTSGINSGVFANG